MHQRIFMALFYMETEALVWFRDVESIGLLMEWEIFVDAVQTQFRSTIYDDRWKRLID